ncbi:MAG TPA: class I SAM-dependent methyltransferase [Pyrinomonadaceae bacterium]|nr:class I SAM-dependent methyltransferase [Pyrinomonadaceae bacterium]
MNEFLENNRSLWNGWTRLHTRSRFYDVESFKAGKSSLEPLEIEEVGDVKGKSLLHLQCHFGMDTLSWARRGARVVGADFSDEAIRFARALAAELNLPAEFVCANVYDLPAALEDRFDIVYTSYGVLSWLPELDPWAAVAAHFLKPGGFFYIAEYHPLVSMLGDDGRTFEYPYFHTPEPIKLRAQGSYAAPEATDFTHTEYNWSHTLADVINALIRAGLRIEFLHEFPYRPSSVYNTDKYEPGLSAPPQEGGWHVELPHVFSVRARRENA